MQKKEHILWERKDPETDTSATPDPPLPPFAQKPRDDTQKTTSRKEEQILFPADRSLLGLEEEPMRVYKFPIVTDCARQERAVLLHLTPCNNGACVPDGCAMPFQAMLRRGLSSDLQQIGRCLVFGMEGLFFLHWNLSVSRNGTEKTVLSLESTGREVFATSASYNGLLTGSAVVSVRADTVLRLMNRSGRPLTLHNAIPGKAGTFPASCVFCGALTVWRI